MPAEEKEKKAEKPRETATIRPEVLLSDLPRRWLNEKLREAEEVANKDILTIYGPIMPGVDFRVRMAIEGTEDTKKDTRDRKETLLVILHTPGGVVEEVQNIVKVLRRHYEQVHFLVPIYAMSAGTVLAMSGDKIYMDYFSRLGPIDPQIWVARAQKYVPALSYLHQYEKFIKKANEGTLTTAEFSLLEGMDLAELHSIELAADLSVSLIEEWLTKYKFKNLITRDGYRIDSDNIKREKAKEIATALNDHKRWFSHSYSIHKDILENDLGLQIDDYSTVADGRLKKAVWQYFGVLLEYTAEEELPSFVHSRKLT